MGLPVKTRADQKINFTSETLPDRAPFVAGGPNGRLFIALTEPVDAANTDISFIHTSTTGYATYKLPDTPTYDESQASLAALGNGGAVVVYRSTPDASTDSEIRARLFFDDRTNGTFSTEFLVNTGNTAGIQGGPEAAELAFGRIAFVWIDITNDQIKTAIFDAGGQAIATNKLVSTTASDQTGALYDLGLTALSNGNFVVSWFDNVSVGHFRIMNSAGNAVTGDTTVPGVIGSTDIIELADGNIMLTYYKAGANAGHYGQILTSTGASVGGAFQISSSPGFQAATALHDGRFMVAYNTGGDIFGRIMNADGTPDTAEFRINDVTAGTQGRVHLATLGDGRISLAWEDSTSGGGDIFFNIYDPRETGIHLSGTAYRDEYEGTPFADTISTGNGNDSVDGNDGNDTIYGDAGNDSLGGEAGNDTIFGGAGDDYISGEIFTASAGNDRLDGGLGHDTLTGGNGNDVYVLGAEGSGNDKVVEAAGIDTITSTIARSLAFADYSKIENLVLLGGVTGVGNSLNNKIFGHAGSNVLYGLAGADRLTGGLGRDVLTGGDGNDIFIYKTAADSRPGIRMDVVRDFDDSGNDRIDLSALFGGTLTFKGSGPLTGLHQVHIKDVSGPNILVEVNLTGGLAPDLVIRLLDTTAASMTASDFVL